ncbi:MAG: hypothetical protein U9P07_01245 [Pseudomonadota bacterium]|nr:hypothetical protein [Pseudomonadota bacterium]
MSERSERARDKKQVLLLFWKVAEYLPHLTGKSLISPSKKSRKNLTKENDYIKNRSSLALPTGNNGRATVDCVLSGEAE